jgi:hypothetical protein
VTPGRAVVPEPDQLQRTKRPDVRRRPDVGCGSASSASFSGSVRSSFVAIDSVVRESRLFSRLVPRDRSRFKQTRPTTVVSHPGEIVHRARVGAAEPDPGLVHTVLGFGKRAEHPVRDRYEIRSLLVEALRQPMSVVHQAHSRVGTCHASDPQDPIDVTRRSDATTNHEPSFCWRGGADLRRNSRG